MYIPSDGSGSSGPSSFTGSGGSGRTKRMRTSFKHHQLRTMKQYFAINQNPDAKDLKALAQKTNLSKRVLQVWFQNARAKWRRNNLRMQGLQDTHANNNPALNSSDCLFPSSCDMKSLHHSMETTSSSSCPVITSSHDISCSPGGSSTRPYSSPSASPNVLMTSQSSGNMMTNEDFIPMSTSSPASSSPHIHMHHHQALPFHASISHLHAFQHQLEYPESA